MNTKTLKVAVFCIVALCNSIVLTAQAPYGEPGDRTAVPLGSSNSPFGYIEYLPSSFNDASNDTYPLIIFYHGYSDRGNGTTDLSSLLSSNPTQLATQSSNFDAVIITPQKENANYTGNDFINLYNYIISNYPINLNQVYVTGLSSGGSSTWNALRAHSELIAAALPICGYTNVNNPSPFLQETPIWAVHSFDDETINVSRTINNVNYIANINSSVMAIYPYENGNNPATENYTMQFNTESQDWSITTGLTQPTDKLAFTLYKNGGHNSWTRTYSEQVVWDWMFAQRLNPLSIDEETIDFKLYPNPTSNKVTISTSDNSEKKIEIHNLLGKKIYDNSFFKRLTIDMSTYASGAYFAKIIDANNKEQSLKIVVN
ncbi:T9SS type A sorting domain-containing protein [Winogradskyella bathintestinalis]|uniref:T9SS type A sorting domain-containing protein n=1 Tax=Winogradskyella bathintestinalis TaxID=3035208 RepID=A0ABT7ZR25_9FLAO|nr:T9SS type A sorting domain-containing protein [Winogradskyella bathintestinalis]MDN3491470.1 T9SS type A sorting domain-containing protein [Winogradskyella bathintestinalis]